MKMICRTWLVLGAVCATAPGLESRLDAQQNRRPVAQIEQAIVYTVNESIEDQRGLDLARQVPSDMLIRGWFKWHNAPDWSRMAHLPPQAHAMGALFGGGVTCSALYDRENGLSDDQLRDMATRGTAGELVDAWKTRGCRHGTLSNPKYVDYVLSWCRRQIDAGVDYLFMDEINAVLHHNEGFDDYSVADFRAHLQRLHDWAPGDARWREQYKIDITDRSLCPDGTIRSFEYRVYLNRNGWTADPHTTKNPLARVWAVFRTQRDDRAWQRMTEEIRAYAKSKGRNVYISANGLASRVDLQVLGVWGLWRIKDGNVDFSENQMLDWAATVRSGHARAGKKVPVVLFHDWGFDGFPYLKVPPAQRTLWNRIRGAEIYAAGGFYAFPVHGPFGCDASRDGTIAQMGRQAAFYRQHKALYLNGALRGIDCVQPGDNLLSASLWAHGSDRKMVVHVINRKVANGAIELRTDASVDLPMLDLPRSVSVVSPDWEGTRPATVEKRDGGTRLKLAQLEAYAVAVLEYEQAPRGNIVPDRVMLTKRWERPEVSEFVVDGRGAIIGVEALNGVIQGKLHQHMANPPTFKLNARGPAKLSLQVQAVSTQGARLECLIDGQVSRAIDLPDRDGKNDTMALEMDQLLEFDIPAGAHQVQIRNTGKDWASVRWIRFSGELAEVK